MKKTYFMIVTIIFLVFAGYIAYANNRFRSEEISFGKIKKYEYAFINRNPANLNIKHDNLISQANMFYQQFPSEKNKAIYYGIVYGLGERAFYNSSFINHLANNIYKDDFLEHFCLIQVHSANVPPTLLSISPELQTIISHSIYKNNCN